jgi:hypothetical protein
MDVTECRTFSMIFRAAMGDVVRDTFWVYSIEFADLIGIGHAR